MLDEGRLAVVEDRRLGREVVQALEQVETIRRDPVLGRPAVGEVLARVEHVEALRSTGIARVYWYEVPSLGNSYSIQLNYGHIRWP